MNSDLYFESKKFISSSRAAQISGYANDYIGQLCRGGKLDCRMVGRSWYVSFDSLQDHRKVNVLASKNRNKNSPILTAPTTAPVSVVEVPIVEYHKSPATEGFPKLEPLQEIISKPVEVYSIPISIQETQISIPSPSPAPVLVLNHHRAVQAHHNKFALHFPKLVAGTIALLLSIAAFQIFITFKPSTQVAYQNFGNEIKNSIASIPTLAGEKIVAAASRDSIGPFDKFAQNFYRAVNNVLYDTQTKIFVMLGREEKIKVPVEVSNSTANSQDGQGIVVVPVDEQTDQDAVIAKIQSSFSDEVQIAPRSDGTSGVITPVFKKISDDEYLYVLVPIRN